MKARYGFTPQGRKAKDREIKRQILEAQDELIRDIDAVFLWTLRTELGFGKKRIERIYSAVIRNFKEMCEFYAMNDAYPAVYHLREIGVDLDQLRKENT